LIKSLFLGDQRDLFAASIRWFIPIGDAGKSPREAQSNMAGMAGRSPGNIG